MNMALIESMETIVCLVALANGLQSWRLLIVTAPSIEYPRCQGQEERASCIQVHRESIRNIRRAKQVYKVGHILLPWCIAASFTVPSIPL